jgi:hypothetical protein
MCSRFAGGGRVAYRAVRHAFKCTRGTVSVVRRRTRETCRRHRARAGDTRECILDVAEVAVPNYNKQWKAFDPIDLRRSLATAHDAARRALELVDGASSVEQALIRPLAKRYPSTATAWGS